MFETAKTAPPDPIFGLLEAYGRDQNPHKINLSAGVFQDDQGQTPVLKVVKAAERTLLAQESSKSYLPIAGLPAYGEQVRHLLFGQEHEALSSQRAVTVQSPGGTGALRLAAELMKVLGAPRRVWLSEPTWANHPPLFRSAGFELHSYPHLDPQTNGLNMDGLLAALEQARQGDLVLLQGCCHNPTGVDPSPEQWAQIGELMARRQLMPLVDFAYQGFADGAEEDAQGLRILSQHVPEMMVASSYSKNFGLYRERVGALTVVAHDSAQALAVLSQLKPVVRAIYSNPPSHGAAIVAEVLQKPELSQSWLQELAAMRQRIRRLRERFVDALDQRGVQLSPEGNQFIIRQRGMFSLSRLEPDEVAGLRRESIYVVGSGRINVAGIQDTNLDRLCDVIASLRVAAV